MPWSTSKLERNDNENILIHLHVFLLESYNTILRKSFIPTSASFVKSNLLSTLYKDSIRNVQKIYRKIISCKELSNNLTHFALHLINYLFTIERQISLKTKLLTPFLI